MRSRKTIGLMAIGGLTAIGLAVSTIAITKTSPFSFVNGTLESENHIVLNSGNKVTSAGTVTQKTAKNNDVKFTYSNVASSTSGHVTLNTNGYVVNKDQITSIETITATFTGSGTLKFKTSYDGETWGSETSMTSAYQYELGSNPYYVQFTAFSSSITIASIDIEYSCTANPNASGHEVQDEATTTYQKVASSSDLESGEKYLIVCEGESKAFDGSLDTLDATSNYVSVSISNGTIQSSNSINSAVFTITSVSGGYSIRSYSSYYIGNGSDSNGLTSSASSLVNTISISNDGSAAICSSGGAYLRFNKTSNQLRFRYFKSGTYTSQQPICLYKQVVTQAGSHIEFDTPENEIIGFTATDSKANSYKTTDVFDTANGLTVVANLTGDTTQTLSKGGENGYSYVVKDSNDVSIDTSKAFGGKASATYTLIVSYKNFIPQEIILSVEFIRTLTSISDVSTSPSTFNTAQKLAGNLSELTVTLNYNDDTNETVTYSDFASKGIEAVLLTPSGVTYNQNNAFGTAGDWTLRVRSTSNNSIYGDTTITVNAIPVVSVSLDKATATVEEGKTVQLVATVSPDNATNKNITWTSSNTTIATVDTNGLVTGVKAGEATITATSTADGTKYGSCVVTVTEKVVGLDEGLFVLNSSGAPTVGSYVVIASTYDGSAHAMSNTQNTNNRPGVGVTITSKTIERTSSSGFRAFRVEEGTTSGTVAFYDEVAEGYLYAASSSSNQMKTESTKTANSSWLVTGSESKTIAAQGSNTHNLMRWNAGSSLFSCYSSGQSSPYIFEKAGTPIYATSISISGDSSVSVGGQTQLSVSFTPNDTNVKAVTWTSSNDLVAGVENGLVTGIKQGTVTITASVKGEGGVDITATKTISVNNVSVSSVSLDKNTASISTGSTTTLVPTISPSNATNKAINWSTSDNSVATVDGGVVTGVGAGTATITVTTVDGNKTASCTVTVTSNGSSTSSSEDIINNTATSSDLGNTASNTWAEFNLSLTSGATYHIRSMGTKNTSNAMQWNANAYLYSTVSGGEITSVAAVMTSGKSVEVYGSTSAFSANSGGTSMGTLTGTDSLTSTAGYTYIRIKGTASSTAITSITITYGTPEPTDPTSITVNPSTADIAPGGSKSLSVSYLPLNANQNKAVTWTSSNDNVATVDTSGKVTVKSTATKNQTATITAKLTNLPSITSTCTVTVVETPKADQTVLIYICGADLETDNQLATGDIQEMLKVSGQPDDVNVVIETGGAKSWASTYGISSTYLQRHHIEGRQLITDDSLTYANMGSSSTLQSFISYGLANYPAERTGLILWNHGGGMRGVCYDEKKNDDNLLDYEVKNAVSGALSSAGMSGEKLEWIGYDACLMQVQDIAEMNSPYFNYMIASEESEAGYGWDYDTWFDDLYAKKTTPTILKAIVDGFITDNGGTSSSKNDQTLSYLTLSYASAYKTAWENMASQLSNKLTSSNKSSFNSLVKSCKYYADSDYTYFGLFDAKDFINKLSNNSTFNPGSTYTNAVLTAHGNLVTYSSCGRGAGNSYGLAMYWSAASDSGKSSIYTSSHTNFANWRSIVSTYGS